jgi:lipopolysaccharide export system permease protein
MTVAASPIANIASAAKTILTGLSYLNPWRKHRLETYILGRCLMGTFTALMVVTSIILLIDYVEVSKSLGQKADLSSFEILGLLMLKSPNIILVLLPFAFLFGSLSAFVTLNRSSELIAMRAAGVSAWRFVMPATLLAGMVGILTVTALNPLASMLADNFERVKQAIDQSSSTPEPTVIFLRQGDGNRQTVISARSVDSEAKLSDVTFWNYMLDENDKPIFVSRIDAKEATLKNIIIFCLLNQTLILRMLLKAPRHPNQHLFGPCLKP